MWCGWSSAKARGWRWSGLAIGLAGAAFATRAMQSLLFETSGLDPLTFIAAPLVLGLAARARELSAGAARRIGRADHRVGKIGARGVPTGLGVLSGAD